MKINNNTETIKNQRNMKRFNKLFLSLIAALFAFSACDNIPSPDYWAQTRPVNVLFNEDFGIGIVDSFPTINQYRGFRTTGVGAASVRYSSEGTVTIRTTAPSNGYRGASGGANAMFAPAGGARLLVEGIAVFEAQNLILSFGSNQTDAIITVEYQVNDAGQWFEIDYRKTTENWGLVDGLRITLPEGVNTINLRFTAGMTTHGARIDDIRVTTHDEINPDDGEEPVDVGEGTEENPFNVIGAFTNQGQNAWVEGYIVGVLEDIDGNNLLERNPPFTRSSNIVIALTPTTQNPNEHLPVQLPFGAVRDGLNLADSVNVAHLGKKVKLYGMLQAYFGIPGIRDVVYFEFEDGTSGGIHPNEPPVEPTEAIFLETFGNSAPTTGTRPSIAEYDDYDNDYPVVFSGNTDVRATAGLNTAGFGSHIWFAANSDRYLIISGINTENVDDLRLSIDLAHNASNSPFPTADVMMITVKDLNTGTETPLTVPATDLGDRSNFFVTISDITGIPATSNLEITFRTTQAGGNTMGIRLDNVRIDGVKP